MRNKKGFIGLTSFVAFLWVLVVVTYARQVKEDGAKLESLLPMTSPSCSSSSSTSTSGGDEPGEP